MLKVLNMSCFTGCKIEAEIFFFFFFSSNFNPKYPLLIPPLFTMQLDHLSVRNSCVMLQVPNVPLSRQPRAETRKQAEKILLARVFLLTLHTSYFFFFSSTVKYILLNTNNHYQVTTLEAIDQISRSFLWRHTRLYATFLQANKLCKAFNAIREKKHFDVWNWWSFP